ncbi:hypothetical protein [Geobacter sp.]|nr:hypothetical protein [Geobacter sp.]
MSGRLYAAETLTVDEALDAETAHIQATYDYHTALARLDRAVGKE